MLPRNCSYFQIDGSLSQANTQGYLFTHGPGISKFTNMLIVLFAELCLRDAENSFRMIENVLNMLDKPSL